MSSSGDEDEVESVEPSEPTEVESDSDRDSDLDLDSDADSDFALADLDERAYSHTMCYPTCGMCRFEFVEGEEFVVCRYSFSPRPIEGRSSCPPSSIIQSTTNTYR